LFPSVHHSSVFAINNQPSTIHSLLRHLFFSHSTAASCFLDAFRHLRDEKSERDSASLLKQGYGEMH
jgi:hypothetical protein